MSERKEEWKVADRQLKDPIAVSFLCSGFHPRSLWLCRSPLRRALNLLCIKRKMIGCLQSIVYFKIIVFFFWQFTQSFSAILLEKQKQNTYTSQDGNKRKPQPVKDNFVPVSTQTTRAFWHNTLKKSTFNLLYQINEKLMLITLDPYYMSFLPSQHPHSILGAYHWH